MQLQRPPAFASETKAQQCQQFAPSRSSRWSFMSSCRFVLVSTLFARGVVGQSPGFMLISAPRDAKISWVKLPDDNSRGFAKPQTLIDTGLLHPQGIAVDQKRKRLFVADPDVQKIYSYQLKFSSDKVSIEGRQRVVSTRAESRWVAVDGIGNVFFSDEPQSLILKVSADKVFRGEVEPEVVYSGASAEAHVNMPGGVAADNFHLFWTNKHFGTEVGAVVRASETPSVEANTVSVLAHNVQKSYGICLALNNVFYTDTTKNIFGIKKTGGPIGKISSELQRPRGCAWDGDGTVYVADPGQSAVFSFPSNQPTISHTPVTKAFDAEDAFGLALALDISLAASRRMLFGVAVAVAGVLLRI